MAEEVLDANAAQRRYWNTVAGPRWVAAPGFRERRNQESTAFTAGAFGHYRWRERAGNRLRHRRINCAAGRSDRRSRPPRGGRHLRADARGRAPARSSSAGCTMSSYCSGTRRCLSSNRPPFDLATSRMGVMFFANPTAAFRNIGGALKRGGRLTFACWAPLSRRTGIG